MSSSPLLASPTRRPAEESANARKVCPLGANCSCVFGGIRPDNSGSEGALAGTDAALSDEVTNLTDWGWNVASASAREVILERRRSFSFCVNVLLCLVTGFLWLIYWVPRARHPRFDRTRVTLAVDGTVTSARMPSVRRW